MNTYLVTIYGKGGHGAEPHEAIDTTVIASEFVRKTTKYKKINVLSNLLEIVSLSKILIKKIGDDKYE